MDIQVYKWLHLVGAFALVMSFGAMILRSSLKTDTATFPKRTLSIAHGVGLLLLAISGFGILARMGIHGEFPLWVWLKIALWIALGGMIALVKRVPNKNIIWWWLVLVLAAAAAWIGLFKV